jgi:hypothetical protein
VQDFVGAEQKGLDGDFGKGLAGNIHHDTDPTQIVGIAPRNSPTELFKSGAPLGTWSLGLGGTMGKASTKHSNTARPHSALGGLSTTELPTTTTAPALETLVVSARPLNTQTRPEDPGPPRP